MLKITLWTSFVVVLLIFQGCLVTGAPQFQSQQQLNASERKTVIVTMRETARSVLDGVANNQYASQREKFNTEYTLLRALATRTQKHVVGFLNTQKQSDPTISFTSLWITNQLVVRNADDSLVQSLKSSRFPEVLKVEDEKVLQLNARNQRTRG